MVVYLFHADGKSPAALLAAIRFAAKQKELGRQVVKSYSKGVHRVSVRA